MTELLRKFIKEHAEDNPAKLLLNASRYSGVDVKAAVVQIKARNQVKDKLPSWHRNEHLFFPSVLAAEQCSSEITALYKQRFVQSGDRLCDLTGGLGVDTYFFAQKASHVTYVEKKEDYCTAARFNFCQLKADAVDVIHADSLELLANRDERIADVTVFYADPARRGDGNSRLFAISDCEPDLTKIIGLLQPRSKLIVKLSPMLDVTQVLRQIPNVSEVHVVAIKNDCKELLTVSVSPSDGDMEQTRQTNPIILSSDGSIEPSFQTNPIIYCINYAADGTEQQFRFRLSDERASSVPFAKDIGRYLYEPNVSILKAGGYKSVALQYNIAKLHTSSHLYTSDYLITPFAGRTFEITEIIPFSSHICKTLHKTIPQANIAVRNFPLSTAELRQRTQITDGGHVYLFATTLSDNQKTLIKCSKPT